jgi:hypothetical protein
MQRGFPESRTAQGNWNNSLYKYPINREELLSQSKGENMNEKKEDESTIKVERDLQKEIKDLEESKNVKILGIEIMDGILTRPVVEAALDSLSDTLEQINLDEISESVNNDIKEFSESVSDYRLGV